jgi:hypothetical protein
MELDSSGKVIAHINGSYMIKNDTTCYLSTNRLGSVRIEMLSVNKLKYEIIDLLLFALCMIGASILIIVSIDIFQYYFSHRILLWNRDIVILSLAIICLAIRYVGIKHYRKSN